MELREIDYTDIQTKWFEVPYWNGGAGFIRFAIKEDGIEESCGSNGYLAWAITDKKPLNPFCGCSNFNYHGQRKVAILEIWN